MTPAEIRARTIKERRRLSASTVEKNSRLVCEHIFAQELIESAEHIAFYMATDGEIDLALCIEFALQQKKHCYLPIVGSQGDMQFRQFGSFSELTPNRWGILEPRTEGMLRPPNKLDIVFVPLVAVDSLFNRVGMGGGYYDRAFAFKQDKLNIAPGSPKLVGCAHAFQIYDEISANPWDVKLDVLVANAYN